MNPTLTTKFLVAGSVVVTSTGAIDAAIGTQWDLFASFVLAGSLSLTLLVRMESRRPAIPVRRDLVVWLHDRALVSGEPLSAVTDRALSAYRERYEHAPAPADRGHE